MEAPFAPPGWARNRHLQTILGSLKLRAAGSNEMVCHSREVLLQIGGGVRLLGLFSQRPRRKAAGLVILLHGWEGSADSAYMLSAGRSFFQWGYDVFRLNLRDHGNSHHLNPELFHGALTEEVFLAVHEICLMSADLPCFLIGFSLGGNFALRIAQRLATAPIANLRQVFCVSPALDPYKATLTIDASLPLYRHYFLRKWKRSLRIKQRCFPERYRFDDILHHQTVLGLTAAIMPYYTQFSSYQDYFQRYTLTEETLRRIAVPTTIFFAQDDPVVPYSDLAALGSAIPLLRLSLQTHGGHCGFIEGYPFTCWYERQIACCLQQIVEE